MSEIYRFRTIDNLFGKFNELEHQSIYFASPEQLNDPMEDFRDIFWDGDDIVWENLFKHYIYCAQQVFFETVVVGDSCKITDDRIPVFGHRSVIDAPAYLQVVDEIEVRVFNESKIDSLIRNMAFVNNEIRRGELAFYLNNLHTFVLPIIQNIYVDRGYLGPSSRVEPRFGLPFDQIMTKKMSESLTKSAEEVPRASFFELLSDRLLDYVVTDPPVSDSNSAAIADENRRMVAVGFPSRYLDRLVKLVYPEWYVACFAQDDGNITMWSHYADGHKGVCLIFETNKQEEGEGLTLTRRYCEDVALNDDTGRTEQIERIERHFMPFHNVKYRQQPEPIEFFRQIGALTRRDPFNWWYTNDNGDVSDRASHLSSDITREQWKDIHWERLNKVITSKTKDWSYERESRLYLIDSLQMLVREKHRAFSYEFKDLTGVVFGMKCPENDVQRVSEVIRHKFEQEGHPGITLYRALYSPVNGQIARRTIRSFKNADDS